jgi:carbonic anhydrase
MRNERWAKHTSSKDPSFFPRHYPGQRPEVLWIGCESRHCAAEPG